MSISSTRLQPWHSQDRFREWKVLPSTFTEPAEDGHAYFIVSPDYKRTAFVFNGSVGRVFATSKVFQAVISIAEIEDEETMLQDFANELEEPDEMPAGFEPDGVDVFFNKEGTRFAFAVFIEGLYMLCIDHRLFPVPHEVVSVDFAPQGDSYVVYYQQSKGEYYAELNLEQSWIMHGKIEFAEFSDDGKHFLALQDADCQDPDLLSDTGELVSDLPNSDSMRDADVAIIYLDGQELATFETFQSWNLSGGIRIDDTATQRFLLDKESRWALCGWFEDHGDNVAPFPVVGLISLSDRQIEKFRGVQILSARCSEFFPGFDLIVLKAEDKYSRPHKMSIPLR